MRQFVRWAESGDHGILVSESDGNLILGNVAHRMSDSGITLEAANDGVVRGNAIRFGTGGIQLDGSSRNRIDANVISETTGIGIELAGGSLQNRLGANTVKRNGAQGIYLADDTLADDTLDALGNPAPALGNSVRANLAQGNAADGIVVAKGSHAVAGNVALDNGGWGIRAAAEATDGGGNLASGNAEPAQCSGVVCRADVTPPQTTIVSGPTGSSQSTTATFTFRSSELGSTFRCSFDGAAYQGCASPKTYTNLRAGSHTFRVRATDASGNQDTTPAGRRWTVEHAS